MANEFKHKDIGPELFRAEWEAVDGHEADSQVANDMLYYNGINWVRATKATILNLLNVADGADVSVPSSGGATKGFFIPATYPGSNASIHGYYPIVKCDALNETVYMSFYVPHDFNSITSAVIIVIPLASQAAADWDIRSNYAAIGENIVVHEENDNVTAYTITVNDVYTFFAVDISGILSSLVAEDYVGIRLKQSTTLHNVSVLGIRFRYN